MVVLVGYAGQQPSRAVPAPGQAASSGDTGKQAADPVRVRVPAVGIDAPVGPLFMNDKGVLAAPESFEAAGWWHDGPEPGEIGPAVVAGHVDSYRGPAVFFRLDEIAPGDEIFIDRADGSTVAFVATRTERHPKDEFPTEAVYGGTPEPQLRLITCGGAFDDEQRRYLANVIVYADRSGG
ncbi:MAG: class F sortase [Pseudonocardiaceae bacterium]|nr:class F sortase [Pseudonocardiaceae bacterium]